LRLAGIFIEHVVDDKQQMIHVSRRLPHRILLTGTNTYRCISVISANTADILTYLPYYYYYTCLMAYFSEQPG